MNVKSVVHCYFESEHSTFISHIFNQIDTVNSLSLTLNYHIILEVQVMSGQN